MKLPPCAVPSGWHMAMLYVNAASQNVLATKKKVKMLWGLAISVLLVFMLQDQPASRKAHIYPNIVAQHEVGTIRDVT